MSPLEGLLTAYITMLGLAILCDAVAKTHFTGPVASAPFRLIIWVGRGILRTLGDLLHDMMRAIGRGIAQILQAVHNYLYHRWPGATVIVYFIAAVAILLWIF